MLRNCKRIFRNLLPSNKSAGYGWGKLHQKIIKTGFKKVFIGYRIFAIKHVKGRQCLFSTIGIVPLVEMFAIN